MGGPLLLAFNDAFPQLGPDAFVHNDATVIGNVLVGERASVWPRAVCRGDRDTITIGAESNVQDGAVLHADAGAPCTIGRGVSVGHLACVHGCTIEDDVIIGIGAIVLNGAVVGTGSIVGAGALVPEGRVIPPGSLVLGMPANVVRPVTGVQCANIGATARRYVELARIYAG